MMTLELTDATGLLKDYAKSMGRGPVVFTKHGKPVAALVRIVSDDQETVSLSTNPKFIAMIERSRARCRAEGTIPSADLRRELGLSARKAPAIPDRRRNRSASK